MRIAIVHYHLRPGGVTKVIQHSLDALAEPAASNGAAEAVQPLVLTGEPPAPDMPVAPYAVIEALGYNTSPAQYAVEHVATQLETAVKHALGGRPDVWHFHNPALGKNLVMPVLVSHLARQGQPILIQIHDFAEDGRPANYKLLRDYAGPGDPLKLGAYLYPQGPHVHYAVLNQRDRRFLTAAGVPADRLHDLPNAVRAEENGESEQSQKEIAHECLFLYPTRAIRRKNIGEFLLWAAVAEAGERFAVTRAPKNPLEQPIYQKWVAFAKELALPVKFAVGEQWTGDFAALLASAAALVTTSVGEGFGLVFLEPWLLRRPLVGRKLPEITTEFERAGLDLTDLYEQIRIPLEWVGRDRFVQEVRTALTKAYALYGRPAGADDVKRAVAAAITEGRIDFGRLNEPLQQAVIQRLRQTPALKKEISPATLQPTGEQRRRIQQNEQLVQEQFNLPAYGKRLRRIYHAAAVSESGAISGINADALLDQFLTPERFCLLRT